MTYKRFIYKWQICINKISLSKYCFNQEFELVNDRWCLKKSYQTKYNMDGDVIENSTKFYSDEKCYLKDDFLSKYRADQGYFQ